MKLGVTIAAVMMTVLVAGCGEDPDEYDGLAGEPEFSDPTDGDEPDENVAFSPDPPPADPDPVDVPSDPVVSQ